MRAADLVKGQEICVWKEGEPADGVIIGVHRGEEGTVRKVQAKLRSGAEEILGLHQFTLIDRRERSRSRSKEKHREALEEQRPKHRR